LLVFIISVHTSTIKRNLSYYLLFLIQGLAHAQLAAIVSHKREESISHAREVVRLWTEYIALCDRGVVVRLGVCVWRGAGWNIRVGREGVGVVSGSGGECDNSSTSWGVEDGAS
jgi:hypothetical protein